LRAVIWVDVQNDFCPGGALAVPEGDQVVPLCNRLADAAPWVVATQDWHPPDHGSFARQHPGRQPYEVGELAGLPQVLWPAHCVQNTGGALFAPGLRTDRIHRVFPKGTDPTVDSYSGFFDNHRRRATGLGDWLRQQGVREVLVAGLATDYCVRATAMDALDLGFRVTLAVDACRGVGLGPDDVARALTELQAAGARLATTASLLEGGV
jgi:nicotinamidase/pyrazinamidase